MAAFELKSSAFRHEREANWHDLETLVAKAERSGVGSLTPNEMLLLPNLYLGLWNWDGTLDRIHHALYLKCREKAAREASPTACIIDSQSVKSAEKGGLASTATASMPAS